GEVVVRGGDHVAGSILAEIRVAEGHGEDGEEHEREEEGEEDGVALAKVRLHLVADAARPEPERAAGRQGWGDGAHRALSSVVSVSIRSLRDLLNPRVSPVFAG